jgi:prepilin-type N-terminal cleavage/methylation domain-containing protein
MNYTRIQSRGFTLVELMCSMAIGSVILILSASVLGSSGEGYERVGGSVASEREARALITQLASDLSSGRFHKDGVIGKSAAAWPVDCLGFLSLQPAQAQTNTGRIGDLCAVNYYVKDLSIGGKIVRCLMRGFRESGETFNALRGGSIAPLFAENAVLDEPVAFGVVSFEARPKSRDADGKWGDWIQNDTTGPESLDIKLVLARRQLAGRLKSPGDWDAAGMSSRHKDLEVYATTLRFGNHAN